MKQAYWLLMKPRDDILLVASQSVKTWVSFGIFGKRGFFNFLDKKAGSRGSRHPCVNLFAFHFIKSILTRGPSSLNYISVMCFLRRSTFGNKPILFLILL